MGAQLSAATRELTSVIVSVLDRHPAYRASLIATLRRYQSDADIPASQALQWTSEKLCKDLFDPLLMQQPFTDALQTCTQATDSALPGLDKSALSSCIGRAAMLVLEELKLDLAVHARLFECAADGRLERVRKLEPFVDMDYADAQGATVVMLAAHYGHSALVAYLLTLQPPPALDAQDQYGWTALMHASRNGHLSCVRLLTAHGASVGILNASRCSALMCAADSGHFAVVRHLLTLHAEVDAVSRSGDTALLQAARGGHLSILKALVAAGANVSHVGRKQQSAVHIAASQARWDIVEYVVSEGAAVDGVDDEGRSICHYEVKPAIAQPLDATLRSSLGGSNGGQLAAAIQRGIVGRFNRTIQRSVQPVVAHNKLSPFHRQQLSNGHMQQPHSTRTPSPLAHHDSVSAAEDDEREEGEVRTQRAAANARLTHKMRVGRAKSALDGGAAVVAVNDEVRRRRRHVRKQQRVNNRAAKSRSCDDELNLSVGTVVQGEDDEDEPSSSGIIAHTATAVLSSASSLAHNASLGRFGAVADNSQSLSAPASPDLDLDRDIDDDAQLLAHNNSQAQSPSAVRLVSQQRPAVSPIATSPVSERGRSSMARPVNPTPRQAAHHTKGHSGQSDAAHEEEKGEQRVHQPHTTHANGQSEYRSHRRHRSISTSPSQPPPHRARPSTQSRLTALRQATFLPTSSAARALRQATEDAEDNDERESGEDRWSDNRHLQQLGDKAPAADDIRTRRGSHHSNHQSPLPLDSWAADSGGRRHDISSSSESDSASHPSSSFDSSSSSSDSDSSNSSSSSPRRSPVRPLHSRSSTNPFKSVFSSRSHSSGFIIPQHCPLSTPCQHRLHRLPPPHRHSHNETLHPPLLL